jgi:hypothetical protein
MGDVNGRGVRVTKDNTYTPPSHTHIDTMYESRVQGILDGAVTAPADCPRSDASTQLTVNKQTRVGWVHDQVVGPNFLIW